MATIIRCGGGCGAGNILTVAVESGSVVTATCGNNVVTATSVDGIAKLNLKGGTWALTATKNGQSTEDSIIIVDEYRMEMSFGLPTSSLPVGALIKANLNGAGWNFRIVHQGLPSSMYDESCNGTWLLMNDIYEKCQWHSSNVNDYENSTIHNYLNSTFLGLLDANIREQIKTVKIPYVNGTANSAVASGANGLSAQIFLLSGYEVGFTQSVSSYFPIDGAKLDYFVSGNDSTAQVKRIANLNGTATYWWLRSPHTHNTAGVWYVRTNGNCNGYNCSDSYGVRPALVLSSDAMADPTPNADGSYTLIA